LADDNGRSALSSELQELEKEWGNTAEEIQRLQQKLSVVDREIYTRKTKLQRLADEELKRTAEVESRLAALQVRRSQLTQGNDILDRGTIASVDAIWQRALDVLSSFLQ